MKSQLRDWSDLRVFLAVIRSGSTLAAAKRLGLSQPTVARRIDALEHALKLTLFKRDTRGFHPTETASRLAEHAVAVEAEVAAFAAEAERALRAAARPIRFTAGRMFFTGKMAAILSEFTATHPGTHFELISSYRTLDLVAGEADVALRMAKQIADGRLICTKLTEQTVSLYASRSYAECHGLPASPSDLSGHRFVTVVFEKVPVPDTMQHWLLERIQPAQIVSRTTDSESLVAAVTAGLGIAPLPTLVAEGNPMLVRCFDPPEGTSRWTWLVISPEAWRRPEVKAFAAFFAPRFRKAFPPDG